MNPSLSPMRTRRLPFLALLAVLGAWLASPLRAAPLPQSAWLATVGTTWRQTNGTDWAYLLYQTSDASSLAGRTLAVYRKDGEAGSPGIYTRQAVTRIQENPAVIAPLLDRSINVGESLPELDAHVTGLFQKLIPAPDITLAEKLAAVVQGLNADPTLHSQVLLLSRRHPGASLALGMAWAEPLPSGYTAFTYELREFNPVTAADGAVVARVTIRPGTPLVLPAPGAAVEVPTNSPIADLVARLRWATPDPLRRLAPAQMGFNVYRVRLDRAAALGLTNAPPAPGLLATLAASGSGVERVNEQPVLPPVEFGTNDVANFTIDPTTVFVTDSRERFKGGPGYRDGERFCYFVAARDILGRDGAYSPPSCLTLCDRVPPSAPRGLKVFNDYLIENGQGVQRLRLSFEPSSSSNVTQVARYAVYRWPDRNALHEDKGKALPIGFVQHRAGTNKFSFVDRGPNAPSVTNDAGKVFWYTVRAVQDTACGPLLSPDSAPARGIPRDRVGPKGGPPLLTLREPVPTLVSIPFSIGDGATNLPQGATRYVLRATRTNREIAWVNIDILDRSIPGGRGTLGRHYFPAVQSQNAPAHATSASFNSLEWNLVTTNRPVTNIVTFGLANGVTSQPFTVVARPPQQPNDAGGVQMNLSLAWQSVAAGDGHTSHYPRDITPEAQILGGRVTGVPVLLSAPEDARQWRLYRRLDDGPITLVAEDEIVPTAPAPGRAAAPAATTNVGHTDDAMPINTAGARYYSQYLDAEGNAGPLVPSIGVVFSTVPPQPSALTLIPGDGGTNDPTTNMSLTWSAAPYGLARYRIWIGNPERKGLPILKAVTPTTTSGSGSGSSPARNAAPAAASPLPTTIARTISPPGLAVYRDFVTETGVTNLPCTIIDTSVIGGRVGAGPVYSNLLNRATISSDLYVLVEPVAADGTVGPPSQTLVLRAGAGVVDTNNLVDWPRRPLPPARTDFATGTPGFQALRIKNGDLNGAGNADYDGIAVVVGHTSITATAGKTPSTGRNAWLNTTSDPDDLLFKDPENERPIFGQVVFTTSGASATPPFIEMPTLLISQPIVRAVLYRRQLPSAAFPQPAGDLVQVTPLLSGLKSSVADPGTVTPAPPVALPATQVTDPFIGIFPYSGAYGICLLDTQPIIANATYEYHLLRFDEFGEMIDVLTTNPVTATP